MQIDWNGFHHCLLNNQKIRKSQRKYGKSLEKTYANLGSGPRLIVVENEMCSLCDIPKFRIRFSSKDNVQNEMGMVEHKFSDESKTRKPDVYSSP